MTVTIKYVKTGEFVRLDASGTREFDWSEGNYSCDCNRALFMGFPELSHCGHSNFLVIDSDDPGFNLRQWNEDYPEDLIKKEAK